MIRVCFVCLGNICRSPTAEAVMRELLETAKMEVHLESAGTGGWHIGERPDPRTREAGRRYGLDVDGRAQQFTRVDFARFDLVIALDRSNRSNLRDLAPDDEERAKIHLLREFDPDADGDDVPDPYYGGEDGFDDVVSICRAACEGLLTHLRSR